jgi:hypothetical protein
MRELTDLKIWIYQKRVQHRKEKTRAERQANKQVEVKDDTSEELKTESVQPSFF